MRDFDIKLDTITTNNIKAYFEIKSIILIDRLTINFSINRIDFHII